MHIPSLNRIAPLSMEEVVAVLTPEFGSYIGIVLEAWDSLAKIDPSARQVWSVRTRCSHVYDEMRNGAARAFTGREGQGIRLSERQGLFIIQHTAMDETINVRLKFVDKNGKTHNISTRQQQNFREKRLFDWPEATNITLGYMVDLAATQVERIILVSEQRGYTWRYRLPYEPKGSTIPLNLPELPKPQAPIYKIKPKTNPENDPDDGTGESKTGSSEE